MAATKLAKAKEKAGGGSSIIHPRSWVSIADARNQFADLVNKAAYGKDRLVITRKGKELVGVVPVEDLQLLEALEDVVDLQEARAALVETKKKGSVSWEKVKKGLGL